MLNRLKGFRCAAGYGAKGRFSGKGQRSRIEVGVRPLQFMPMGRYRLSKATLGPARYQTTIAHTDHEAQS